MDKQKVNEIAQRTEQTLQMRSAQGSIGTIKQLLSTPEMKNMISELINMSNLTEIQKTYLKKIFIEKKSTRKAMQETFKKDVGYAVEPIRNAINGLPEVKELQEAIKSIYLRFVPVASLKEFEMIMNPATEEKVRLEAIKDVKSTAGISEEQQKSDEAPVKITLNFGTPPIQEQPIQGEEIK